MSRVVDPRVVRTHERLRAAVLELASETPVEELALEQVCAASGVSRATLYRYAVTPVAILQELMHEELDGQRLDFINEATGFGEELQLVHRGLIHRLVDHVEKFADAYRLSLPLPLSALRPVLFTHMHESMLGYVRRRTADIALLGSVGSPSYEFRVDALARSCASGDLGVIEAWCASAERDRQNLEELIFDLTPAWNLKLMGL